jgi:hypothetical protein
MAGILLTDKKSRKHAASMVIHSKTWECDEKLANPGFATQMIEIMERAQNACRWLMSAQMHRPIRTSVIDISWETAAM